MRMARCRWVDFQPFSWVPPCSRTSMRRRTRVSWSLMPAILVLLEVTGSAIFWNSGKSTWTLRDSASNPAKRSEIPTSFSRSRLQIFETLVQAKVLHSVDAHLHTQEGAEFLVHATYQVPAIDAQDVMAVIQLFEHAVQLAAQPAVHPDPKDMSHFICGQAEQAHFAGALKDLVDWEVPFEDEVAAVFGLVDGVATLQVDSLAVAVGKLRRQQPAPVVQALLDDAGAQLVCRRLQGLRV